MSDSEYLSEVIESIQNGEIDKTENYLIFKISSKNADIIENLYGYALEFNNIQIISMLNLHVRSHNIQISKYNIIYKMYLQKCRKEYSDAKKHRYQIQMRDFNGRIEQEYRDKYWILFRSYPLQCRSSYM